MASRPCRRRSPIRGQGSSDDRREVITPMQLPSHTGHRPEGRHGRPCRRRPARSVSTAAEHLASKWLPRSLWQSRCATGSGTDSLYLADLDAIAGRPPIATLRTLHRGGDDPLAGCAGSAIVDQLAPLLDLDPGHTRLVVGLESVSGPAELADIVGHVGSDRTIFSLDLFDGRPRIAPRVRVDVRGAGRDRRPGHRLRVSTRSSCWTSRGWGRGAGSGRPSAGSSFGCVIPDSRSSGAGESAGFEIVIADEFAGFGGARRLGDPRRTDRPTRDRGTGCS